MISIVTIILFITSVYLGRILFQHWFNHLSLYVFVWTFMILLFQMRLIRYQDLNTETWIYILIAFISYLFGILTYFAGKGTSIKYFDNSRSDILFILDNNAKKIRLLIWIFGGIALLVTLQNWYVLIKMFGDVNKVLINANLIYRMRIQRTIEGQIPYFFIFGYVAVLLSAIYTVYKNKFTFTSFFPFIPIILKEISQVGRAGIMMSFFEFLITFFLFRFFYKNRRNEKKSTKKLLLGSVIIVIVIIFSASIVKLSRGPIENIPGTSAELRQFQDNLFISPTMYLYFSGHVGVLNKFLEQDKEKSLIAENSLLGLYSILSKFEIVKRPTDYAKGYFIPIWINTGTYIRELYSDYGFLGPIIFPFILGLITTILYFRFFQFGNLATFTLLVYMYTLIGFSYFVLITRLASWYMSLVTLLILAFIIRIKLLNTYKK